MKLKFIWLISISILACQQNNLTTEKIDQSEIDSVYNQFSRAYKDLNVDLVRDLYVEDAIYLDPGEPIQVGRTAFLPSSTNMFTQTGRDSLALDIEFRILDRKIISSDNVIDIRVPLSTPFMVKTIFYENLFNIMLRHTSLIACPACHGRRACPACYSRRVSQIATAIFLPPALFGLHLNEFFHIQR